MAPAKEKTKPFIRLYISPSSRRKLAEWQGILHPYGIDVRGIPYPEDGMKGVEQDAASRLSERDPGLFGIVVDNSELVLPGTKTRAPRLHMQSVEHFCRVAFYRPDENGAPRKGAYEGRAPGYLDLRDGSADRGWWDDRFRMAETGHTFSEWRELTGSKVSARDAAAGQLIAEHVDGRPRDFGHLSVNPTRSVSFDTLAFDDAFTPPFILLPEIDRFGLRGLFGKVAHMGVHFRAPTNKRNSNLWEPGLHGGIPTVEKGDPFHETVYALVHDAVHQLVPRLAFDGQATERLRRVDLAYNMLSEAFSLVIADMLFVDAVRASGYEYDYSARAVWPLFESTGLSGAPVPHDKLLELLLAVGQFTVTGKTAALERLVPNGNDAALKTFAGLYDRFFRADLAWNAANWKARAARPDEFRRWWDLVAPVSRANGLGFQTATELADACGAAEEDAAEILVEKIGTHLFNAKLRPILETPPKPAPREKRLSRAFSRWMCGQLLGLVRYDFLPEVKREADIIADALCRQMILTSADAERIRSFFERRVNALVRKGMLSKADGDAWMETVPHVPPRFVGAGYTRVAESHEEAAQRLLGRREDDKNPGVGIFIRTKGGDCILQRKDNGHENIRVRGLDCLFGGSIEVETGEDPEDALRRELAEELRDPNLVAEIMERARFHRRHRLSARPWPGEYTYYSFVATVDQATYDRWKTEIAAHGTVLEGIAVVMNREELEERIQTQGSFLCSHEQVVAELLATA
jgi:adenylate kinase